MLNRILRVKLSRASRELSRNRRTGYDFAGEEKTNSLAPQLKGSKGLRSYVATKTAFSMRRYPRSLISKSSALCFDKSLRSTFDRNERIEPTSSEKSPQNGKSPQLRPEWR
jgi:hypothetical protein